MLITTNTLNSRIFPLTVRFGSDPQRRSWICFQERMERVRRWDIVSSPVNVVEIPLIVGAVGFQLLRVQTWWFRHRICRLHRISQLRKFIIEGVFSIVLLPLDFELVLKLENGPVFSLVFMFFESSSEDLVFLGSWMDENKKYYEIFFTWKLFTHSPIRRIVISMRLIGRFCIIARRIDCKHIFFLVRCRRLRLGAVSYWLMME